MTLLSKTTEFADAHNYVNKKELNNCIVVNCQLDKRIIQFETNNIDDMTLPMKLAFRFLTTHPPFSPFPRRFYSLLY